MNILSRKKIEMMEKSLIYIALFIFIGLTLFPLIWVFTTSLKPNDETMSFPPKLIPDQVTLENYVFVFTNSTIVKSLYNSLIVSFGSMILNVTICALAGYALARFEFKAKKIFFSLILGLFTIPIVINIIPL
jgi:ABC-type glycerol-3-phosphate transport system permease component